jgi:hypothetical protein
MDSILPRLIGAGSHYAAVALATHDDRLTIEPRLPEPLYRHKKGIQVNMQECGIHTDKYRQ